MRATEFLPDDRNEGQFNGVTIRKGSVGAFIFNVRVVTNPLSPPSERATAFKDIEDAIPALEGLGLFEILEIRDESIRTFISEKLVELHKADHCA